MLDPADRPPIMPDEDLNRLEETVYGRNRTPGLKPLEAPEFLVGYGGGFIICLILYINFGVSRFLPFEVDPATAHGIALIAFVGLIVTGAGWLLVIGNWLIDVTWTVAGRIIPRKARVTCPSCTARNSVERYLNGRGCAKCGSHLVYCAKCGKSAEVEQFLSGSGCPHCKHQQFYVS